MRFNFPVVNNQRNMFISGREFRYIFAFESYLNGSIFPNDGGRHHFHTQKFAIFIDKTVFPNINRNPACIHNRNGDKIARSNPNTLL